MSGPAQSIAIADVTAVTLHHLKHLHWPRHHNPERLGELGELYDAEERRYLLRLKRRTCWTHPRTGEVRPIGRSRASLKALLRALLKCGRTRADMTGHLEVVIPISRRTTSKFAAKLAEYGISFRTFTRCMPMLVGANVGILYWHGRSNHNGLIALADTFDEHRGEGLAALERYRAEPKWWGPICAALASSAPSSRVLDMEAWRLELEGKERRRIEARNAHFSAKERAACERAHAEHAAIAALTARLRGYARLPPAWRIKSLAWRLDAKISPLARGQFGHRKEFELSAVHSPPEDRAAEAAAAPEERAATPQMQDDAAEAAAGAGAPAALSLVDVFKRIAEADDGGARLRRAKEATRAARPTHVERPRAPSSRPGQSEAGKGGGYTSREFHDSLDRGSVPTSDVEPSEKMACQPTESQNSHLGSDYGGGSSLDPPILRTGRDVGCRGDSRGLSMRHTGPPTRGPGP